MSENRQYLSQPGEIRYDSRMNLGTENLLQVNNKQNPTTYQYKMLQ